MAEFQNCPNVRQTFSSKPAESNRVHFRVLIHEGECNTRNREFLNHFVHVNSCNLMIFNKKIENFIIKLVKFRIRATAETE